jgi:hypothetical protein
VIVIVFLVTHLALNTDDIYDHHIIRIHLGRFGCEENQNGRVWAVGIGSPLCIIPFSWRWPGGM